MRRLLSGLIGELFCASEGPGNTSASARKISASPRPRKARRPVGVRDTGVVVVDSAGGMADDSAGGVADDSTGGVADDSAGGAAAGKGGGVADNIDDLSACAIGAR